MSIGIGSSLCSSLGTNAFQQKRGRALAARPLFPSVSCSAVQAACRCGWAWFLGARPSWTTLNDWPPSLPRLKWPLKRTSAPSTRLGADVLERLAEPHDGDLGLAALQHGVELAVEVRRAVGVGPVFDARRGRRRCCRACPSCRRRCCWRCCWRPGSAGSCAVFLR